MESFMLLLGWVGIYSPVALAAVGSAIGCTRAGKAACGAILEVDGGYGRYVGLSVLPSSIVIYGIVIMFTLNRPVVAATSPGLFGVGILVGLALFFIGISARRLLRRRDQRQQGQAGDLRALGDAGSDRGRVCRVRIRVRPHRQRRDPERLSWPWHEQPSN